MRCSFMVLVLVYYNNPDLKFTSKYQYYTFTEKTSVSFHAGP